MQATLPQDALKHHQQALLRNPKDLEAQLNCGNLCIELQRYEEAAGYFRRLLRVLKTNEYVRNALCFCLESLGNQAQNAGHLMMAEACFEEAIQYQPGNAIYWYNLGNAQRDLAKPQAALYSFKQSIQFNANDADAHNNLGNVQRELGQLDKAITSYKKALQLNPHLHHALAHLVHQRQHICDWVGENNNSLNKQINQLRTLVNTDSSAKISPFAFLSMPNTTALEQKQCATHYANDTFAHLVDLRQKLNFKHQKQAKTKLKIAYLSADFRLHPLAFLMTELIEQHDKNHFETVAYSYGADDKTPERKRFVKAFDAFVDIRTLNDLQVATKIHQDGVDILVDLTGYTQSSRTAIVALKPAPICVNWLGYPGSMGALASAALFDYVLADKIVAPNTNNFSEKVLFLPCYQPNNTKRPIGEITSKAQNSLPEHAFVFCCFNQSFKITAEVFAAWMQILQAVPNSVLWLLDCNQWAKANIQSAASQAGIDSSRLVFAPRAPIAEHLARHVHVDLFLDTLPYNAHTTASDALYMGVPILTCMGETFASRVAASILLRANLPELVTNKRLDYQDQAIDLAKNPQKLSQIKDKIKRNAAEHGLFNPTLFMQQLAIEYKKIWKDYTNSL